MTRPLRRMTLHFSHMGFTDGLTFIVFNHSFQRFVSFQLKWRLLTAPGDPAAGQVIRGHLHRHLVAGQNPDEIHSEFSGNMCQNLVSISNVYLERCVGQASTTTPSTSIMSDFAKRYPLLVRINLLAVSRKGFAKLAVGDPLRL